MNSEKRGFWDFCCEHPLAAFFIAMFLFQCIEGTVIVLTGHADQAKDVLGCRIEINKPIDDQKAAS